MKNEKEILKRLAFIEKKLEINKNPLDEINSGLQKGLEALRDVHSVLLLNRIDKKLDKLLNKKEYKQGGIVNTQLEELKIVLNKNHLSTKEADLCICENTKNNEKALTKVKEFINENKHKRDHGYIICYIDDGLEIIEGCCQNSETTGIVLEKYRIIEIW